VSVGGLVASQPPSEVTGRTPLETPRLVWFHREVVSTLDLADKKIPEPEHVNELGVSRETASDHLGKERAHRPSRGGDAENGGVGQKVFPRERLKNSTQLWDSSSAGQSLEDRGIPAETRVSSTTVDQRLLPTPL
jgi:hypothetical protein